MNEICRFTTGDLVRFIGPAKARATRFYLVLRAKANVYPGGALNMECWDPEIRGYTYFWDYDLRLVAPWNEREIDEHG